MAVVTLLGIILGTVSIMALSIASYTDLKTREVPDWLNYALIFAAMGIRIIFSFQNGWSIMLDGLLGLTAGFLVASIFYYTHQWGGGDSKLLIGLGTVMGIASPLTSSSFTFLLYLFLVLLMGALFGLLWMMVIAAQNKQQVGNIWREKVRSSPLMHVAAAMLSIILLAVSVWLFPLWWLVPVPLLFFYLFLFVLSVEEVGFYHNVPVASLTEGDWRAEDIYIEGKKIKVGKTLEQEDLVLLRKLSAQKKISRVMIKQGVPFVPSFLLAYLLMMFGKEWVLNILGKVLG